MPNTMSSFGELRDSYESKYRNEVGEKIMEMPTGAISVDHPEIEKLVFVRPLDDESKRTLHVVVKYKKDIPIETVSFNMRKDGTVGLSFDKKRDWKKRPITALDLTGTIANTVRNINPEFWHTFDYEVFPPEELESTESRTPSLAREMATEKREVFDDRLESLRNQSGALFGFVPENGFEGYHGVVICGQGGASDKLVLESPMKGNAAYIIRLAETIPPGIKERALRLPLGQRVTEEEATEVFETCVLPVLPQGISKAATRVRPSYIGRVIHTSTESASDAIRNLLQRQ